MLHLLKCSPAPAFAFRGLQAGEDGQQRLQGLPVIADNALCRLKPMVGFSQLVNESGRNILGLPGTGVEVGPIPPSVSHRTLHVK